MSSPTLIGDPDPIDRRRSVDLRDVGLPGYALGVTIDGTGEEHYAILKYNIGTADYRPTNWSHTAPHDVLPR